MTVISTTYKKLTDGGDVVRWRAASEVHGAANLATAPESTRATFASNASGTW